MLHDDTDPEALLSTGEAAILLGTSSRHVVDLCDRGELPYTMVGTHRRVRRADVLALAARRTANRGGPMTDDQVRSLWLHRVAAAHVARDPERALAEGQLRARAAIAAGNDGARWFTGWLEAIERGPEAVMRRMTSPDPEARELRQNSPFLFLLTEDERLSILASFARAHKRRIGAA